MLDNVIAYLRENETENLDRLMELLRIPSISTEPGHRRDIQRAAAWVHDHFIGCGFESRMIETPGHPCVIADSGPAQGSDATLLVYGHYDVQPVGDESVWRSPPFQPDVSNGCIFARGASDDKGQFFAHLLAAEAWLKVAGKMPMRVKYLIEGEEEIGSPSMRAIVLDHREELASDFIVVSDGWKLDATTPTIVYGTRGFVGKEIVLSGPKNDLHSGEYGGAVANPGTALTAIVAALHDKANRVAIPGFYDDVVPLQQAERDRLGNLPFEESEFLASTGSPCLFGEPGYTTLERCRIRPTLEVNGLRSGFIAEGFSSIVPSKACAKLSMRLVPNQDPIRVSDAFDNFVRRICPHGVQLDIINHGLCSPYTLPIDTPCMQAGASALEAGFGTRALLSCAGGSLPILTLFKELLGTDTLLLGFGIPGCNAHGPNEFLVVEDFHAGARTAVHLMNGLARSSVSGP